MKNTVEHIVQSLIALHGQDALKVAEKAAEEARKSDSARSLAAWLAVIAEIKRIQKAGKMEAPSDSTSEGSNPILTLRGWTRAPNGVRLLPEVDPSVRPLRPVS